MWESGYLGTRTAGSFSVAWADIPSRRMLLLLPPATRVWGHGSESLLRCISTSDLFLGNYCSCFCHLQWHICSFRVYCSYYSWCVWNCQVSRVDGCFIARVCLCIVYVGVWFMYVCAYNMIQNCLRILWELQTKVHMYIFGWQILIKG